jgi:mono/diheme cytochrome c family protein
MRFFRAAGPILFIGASVLPATLTSAVRADAATSTTQPAAATQPGVEFQRDIQPIFAARCESCHGPEKQRGGLRLDSHNAILKGGTDGPVVTAGSSAKSLLIQLVTGQDPDRPMPPKGDRLTERQIALLKAWIDAGAAGGSQGPASQPASAAKGQADSNIDPTFEWATSDASEQFALRRRERLKKLPAPPSPPQVSSEAFNEIDRFIIGAWQKANLPQAAAPPLLCSDATFLRRVYLDLIGRVPTLAETRQFLDSNDRDKRKKLVDTLLARNDEYAAHWTPFWEEALTSSPYTVVGGIPSRGDHQKWIFDSFKENKPYDVMVAELLDPRMPGHRPVVLQDIYGKPVQVGYVLNITHEYTIQTAANVGQVFLGTGMKCASCHSHFENTEWPQQRFLSFASLFNPNDLEVIRCEKKSGKFATAQYAFEIPGLPDKIPADLDGRLHYLTLAMVDPLNPRFAPAIVNRLWKRYIGLGLFEPADDFRLEYPPTHPELLTWLAHDFMTHDYDLKHTIRMILTSRTYQLEFNPVLEDHFDVAKRKDMRFYRSPSLRRLTAEEVIDSVRAIKEQTLTGDTRLYKKIEATALTRALGRPPSRNEVSTCRAEDVAVVQSLELLNGQEFYKLVYSSDALGQLIKDLPADQRIQTLYLAVYNRPPTSPERELVRTFMKDAPASQPGENPTSSDAPGVRDTLWAMLAGPEFQYIY